MIFNRNKSFVIILLCGFALCLICGCSNHDVKKLVGGWEAVGTVSSDFPKNIRFDEDGTGMAQKYFFQWEAKGKRISLNVGVLANVEEVYEFSVSENTLTLSMDGESQKYSRVQ